jgi:scyllo-inositol 2-dehydrogenase (NADP+)
MVSKGPLTRFSIDGTSGSLRLFGLDPQEDRLAASGQAAVALGNLGFYDRAGVFYSSEGLTQDVPVQPGNYAGFYDNLAQALLAKDPGLLLVPPRQAGIVVNLIELAYTSLEKKGWIAINFL